MIASPHYYNVAKILSGYEKWYLLKVNEKTSTNGFHNETFEYEFYYRAVDENMNVIKYCKINRLDYLAVALKVNINDLEEKIIE